MLKLTDKGFKITVINILKDLEEKMQYMNEEMEDLNREMHVFPRGSGANYHKLGGLKQEKMILSQFWRPEG